MMIQCCSFHCNTPDEPRCLQVAVGEVRFRYSPKGIEPASFSAWSPGCEEHLVPNEKWPILFGYPETRRFKSE